MLMRSLRMLFRRGRVLFALHVIALAVMLGRSAMSLSCMFVMFRRFIVMFFGHCNPLCVVCSHWP